MKAAAPIALVSFPTEMPSEKDCYNRLAVILTVIAMNPKSPDDEILKKEPTLMGMFMGFHLMKPNIEPRDALKEIWRNNYETCKEHFEGPKIQ